MRTEQRKQRFSRREIIAAMAGAYRVEQWRLQELAQSTERAAQQGEAAEYTRLDEAYLLQQKCMTAMMTMVAALGIESEEFMAVVNQQQDKQ